ncbi:Uncharacterised protein [Staphylococcus gallinarum]|uniref:Uncharacterized protein n=1 Tax=Staphylococcus gallinarum TaxID=1293 RepID=A0A380FBU5_STAGA|nr:Uncharacterised protein [Staphylococcus gallinarum]
MKRTAEKILAWIGVALQIIGRYIYRIYVPFNRY